MTVTRLVPFVSVEDQMARFDGQGLRHRFVRYPGEDHRVAVGEVVAAAATLDPPNLCTRQRSTGGASLAC